MPSLRGFAKYGQPPAKHATEWAEEDLVVLRELWLEGVSARVIATKLSGDHTHGSISQKAKRTGCVRAKKVSVPKHSGGIHPMWSMEEDARRAEFVAKFNAGWADVQKRLSS